MKKFIEKDDDFGIRKMLKQLYPYKDKTKKDFLFNIWVNQFLPPTFYESQGTIQRHVDQIKSIPYHSNWVWIKRGNSYTCAVITDDLMRQIKNKMVELPTYQEIEEEKQRWQSHPKYDKNQGTSEPLKEEYVQLVFRRGVKS